MGIQILILIVFATVTAMIASSKGRNAVGWFFGGFFLGLIGIIIVAVLPNLKKQREQEAQIARENRRLREQVKQERIKNEAFRRFTAGRLDVHDQALGLDTRTAQALPDAAAAPQLTLGEPLAIPVDPPVARLWYYEVEGQAMGPVPEAEIRNLLQAGRVSPQTLVWCEDLGSWTPAGRVAAFSSRGA